MVKIGHKGSFSGGRCGRLARTQVVEAKTTATVVPPEAGKGLLEAAPDTLCATGSLTPGFHPLTQTDFRVRLPPFPQSRRWEPPVFTASIFRLPWCRLAPRIPSPEQGLYPSEHVPRGTGEVRALSGAGRRIVKARMRRQAWVDHLFLPKQRNPV